MGKVKIKYRPFPFCPFKISKSANISHDWANITPEHFILISELIIKGTIANPIQSLSDIFNVPTKIIELLHPFHQYTIMEQLGKPLSGEIEPRNYLPTLSIPNNPKITLVGPANRLSNLTFGQFIYADSYFMAYGISANNDLFDRHMSVLFRPELRHTTGTTKNSTSTTFTPSQVDANLENIRQLPQATKTAWQYNYIILRSNLENRYTHIFPKVEEELENTDQQPPTTTKTDVYRQWMEVFDHFVGDDIINSEKYFNKNCHEVLRYLDNKILEDAKRNHH